MILALFSDSKDAGSAVAELRNKGYTDQISVVTKDSEIGIKEETVKADDQEVVASTVAGTAVGGLAGLIAGASNIVVPGLGPLLVYGPLVATWGIAGAALGALTGGMVGALASVGVPEDIAKRYESRIQEGDVLVVVTSDPEGQDAVENILKSYNVEEIVIANR